MALPLAHPCNRAGSYRESSISRGLELAECQKAKSKATIREVAAEALEILATRIERNLTVTAAEIRDARQLAINLRRHG